MKHRKKFLALFLAVVMVFSFAVTAFAQETSDPSLTFLHFNDIHANVLENEDSGQIGLAKFKTYIEQVNPDLILDAGDSLHGTTFATLSEGATMRAILQDVGVNVATAGNHDFNYGTDRLIELSRDGNYPILVANYKDAADDSLPFEANMIFDRQGYKIGVFGLATPETKTASNPLNTEGYDFLDVVTIAKEQVEYLESEGADVIIALVHLGLYDSEPLAEAVAGIDIIIDGHSHDTLPEGKVVNGVLIATTGNHLENIGRIDLVIEEGEITSKTAQLVTYDEASQLEANAAIADRIEELNAENDEIGQIVLGEALVDLDGERENVRTRETNLGNLISDIMLETTEADVALTNGGGIRASIPKGQITMAHVLTTFPFTNYLVVIEVSGSDLVAALEHGLRADLDEDGNLEQNGGFPQIGGMRVVYDKTRDPGDRVVTVTVGSDLVDPEASYKLVTNDFLAIGGDGYSMFSEAEKLSEHELLSEVLASYIKAEETISPEVDGRMEQVEDAVTDPDDDSEDLPKTGETQQPIAVGIVLIITAAGMLFIPLRKYQLKNNK
ncbi:MAG: bifunctional metallophosphatase/5'-nucleotidase [Fastidiosipila sp.]|nr:bifunctional metallophosphatase/5'-nucleotidase [Fastidiosipila sp.]